METKKVSKFTLLNNGIFICDIHCKYYDSEGNKLGDKANKENMAVNQTRTMDLIAKIPKLEIGQTVRMKVWVDAGNSNTYDEDFAYHPDGENLLFNITGTTMLNTLTLVGVAMEE